METSVFFNNKTQAVRIPKEFAFPDTVKRVMVRKEGKAIILTPIEDYWEEFLAMEPIDDFPEREQPACQDREDF